MKKKEKKTYRETVSKELIVTDQTVYIWKPRNAHTFERKITVRLG